MIAQTHPSTQEANRVEAYSLENIRVSIEASSVDDTSISANPIINTLEDTADNIAAGTVSV